MEGKRSRFTAQAGQAAKIDQGVFRFTQQSPFTLKEVLKPCFVRMVYFSKPGKENDLITLLTHRLYIISSGMGGRKVQFHRDLKRNAIQMTVHFPDFVLAHKFQNSDELTHLTQETYDLIVSPTISETYHIVFEDAP
jgi:hypothetical protein